MRAERISAVLSYASTSEMMTVGELKNGLNSEPTRYCLIETVRPSTHLAALQGRASENARVQALTEKQQSEFKRDVEVT